MRKLRLVMAQFSVAFLAGCASLPEHIPGPATHAFADVSDTRLARILATATPAEKRGLSGFRMLPEGASAFNARVALARRAEKSIDAQYYLIGKDQTGRQFLRELRDAAMRGVRVRLLVDDLYAAGEDELFVGLAAIPNVQVRIFNPLPMRSGPTVGRLLFSLHEFDRINRRMHNKLLIADNSFAVLGGRNIADAYFMHSAAANFIDLDVLTTGPVVRELSTAFDRYWNSQWAYPIAAVASGEAATTTPGDARRRFDKLVADAAPRVDEAELDILGRTPLAQQLDDSKLFQVYADARVFVDPPDKIVGGVATESDGTVTERTLALFDAARESVEIVSPYFIPGERGLAMMKAGIERGGRVSLITNSLGATDVPLVYEGYARYRLAMLQAGVRIHEISPALARRSGQLGRFGSSYARLHAKVAVIDERWVFIGSMNLDPRSANSNTEIGLVIDSPEMVRVATTLLGKALGSGAYELRLSPDRRHVQWLEPAADGQAVVHDEPPEENGWLRLKLWLFSMFVDEGML